VANDKFVGNLERLYG
jgi:hypothetical protein